MSTPVHLLRRLVVYQAHPVYQRRAGFSQTASITSNSWHCQAAYFSCSPRPLHSLLSRFHVLSPPLFSSSPCLSSFFSCPHPRSPSIIAVLSITVSFLLSIRAFSSPRPRPPSSPAPRTTSKRTILSTQQLAVRSVPSPSTRGQPNSREAIKKSGACPGPR